MCGCAQVCLPVCGLTCMSTCRCMYMYVWRSEVDTVYFPGLLCTLHTEGEFPMEMPTLANESGQPVGSGNSSFLPP